MCFHVKVLDRVVLKEHIRLGSASFIDLSTFKVLAFLPAQSLMVQHVVTASVHRSRGVAIDSMELTSAILLNRPRLLGMELIFFTQMSQIVPDSLTKLELVFGLVCVALEVCTSD